MFQIKLNYSCIQPIKLKNFYQSTTSKHSRALHLLEIAGQTIQIVKRIPVLIRTIQLHQSVLK